MRPLEVRINVKSVEPSNKYRIEYTVLGQDPATRGGGLIYETNNLAIESYNDPYLYLKKYESFLHISGWTGDKFDFILYIMGVSPSDWCVRDDLLKEDVIYILDNVYKLVTEYNKSIGKNCEPDFVFGQGVNL